MKLNLFACLSCKLNEVLIGIFVYFEDTGDQQDHLELIRAIILLVKQGRLWKQGFVIRC